MTAQNAARPLIEQLQRDCPLELGVTEWTTISKREADAFDRLTGGPIDFTQHPGGPFRGTPINPFQLLALLAGFASELGVPGIKSTPDITMLNYGYDDVQWGVPLAPGVRIRDKVSLTEVTEREPGRFLMVQRHVLEAEGQEEPLLTARSPGLAILL